MQAEVLGLARVRLTFRPLAEETNSAIPQQLTAAPPVCTTLLTCDLAASTACNSVHFSPLIRDRTAHSCWKLRHIMQGMQVGVLLVRLCSAALQTGGELTHPAVRLTIGKQVPHLRQPAAVHGWCQTRSAPACRVCTANRQGC
jgi:hypothetical protein